MPTRRPLAGSRGNPAVFALALLLGASAACNRSGDNVIVNNNLDCGLVRTDLFGSWVVTFTPGTTTLTNCDNVAKNGVAVDVAGTPTTYTNVQAIASPSGASFDVIGQGPNLPNELIASVEADSCLALVQLWENDDQGWIQCIGTLDRASRSISAVCDSADLDTNANGAPDVACDLTSSFSVAISTP